MLRKRLSLFVILLLLLQTTAVRADKVDDYVKAEMQKQRIPGLSLAVVKEGKIIKAEGYGLANCDSANPAVIVRGVAAIYLPNLAESVAK